MSYKTDLQGNNTDLQTVLSKVNALPDALDTSDATATAGDIASGKTAYVNGSKVTGIGNFPEAITVKVSYRFSNGVDSGAAFAGGNSYWNCSGATLKSGDMINFGSGLFLVIGDHQSMFVNLSVNSVDTYTERTGTLYRG